MKILLLCILTLLSCSTIAKQTIWLDHSWSAYDPADHYNQKVYSITLPLSPIANSDLFQFEIYHLNGQLAAKSKTRQAMWDNHWFVGKLVSYYSDGTLRTSGVFSEKEHDCDCDSYHTVKNGTFVGYFENGQLKYEREYVYGKLVGGDYEEFDEKGRVTKIYTVENGNYEGTVKHFENGELVREVNYKHGKQDGLYVRYENGKPTLRRHFKEGKQDGFEQRFEDGQLIAEYQFKDNSKQGLQKEFHPNGVLKKRWVTAKYGIQVGEQFIYNDKGKLISYGNRQLAEGKKSEKSVHKEFSENGELIVKRINHGRYSLQERYDETGKLVKRVERTKNGLEGLYVENGYRTIEANYHKGQLHGDYFESHNKSMSKGRYVHDKREGLWVDERPDGTRTESEFHEGKKNGLFAVFDEEGKRIRHARFNMGKVTGDISIDTKSGLHIVGSYKNGKRHGEVKAYTQGGQLLEIGNYKNDKPQGTIYVFSRNGRMKTNA